MVGWLLISAWLFGTTARAEGVVLRMDECATPAPDEVRRLLALELRERLLAQDAPPSDDTLQVSVRCTQDEASIALPGDAEPRRLSLASVPLEHRARLLALSIAERLQRPPPKPAEVAPEPKPAPAAAPLRRDARAEARPVIASATRLPRFALWAGAEVGATPLWAFGASLQFRARLLRLFGWSSALGFTQGTLAIDRGSLRVQSTALRTGPALLLESARGSLHVGLGARLGFLTLTGLPDDGALTRRAQFRTWYLAPAAFAGGLLRLGKYALLGLELELTHTLRRVRADVEGGGARTLGGLRLAGVLGAGATW